MERVKGKAHVRERSKEGRNRWFGASNKQLRSEFLDCLFVRENIILSGIS